MGRERKERERMGRGREKRWEVRESGKNFLRRTSWVESTFQTVIDSERETKRGISFEATFLPMQMTSILLFFFPLSSFHHSLSLSLSISLSLSWEERRRNHVWHLVTTSVLKVVCHSDRWEQTMVQKRNETKKVHMFALATNRCLFLSFSPIERVISLVFNYFLLFGLIDSLPLKYHFPVQSTTPFTMATVGKPFTQLDQPTFRDFRKSLAMERIPFASITTLVPSMCMEKMRHLISLVDTW